MLARLSSKLKNTKKTIDKLNLKKYFLIIAFIFVNLNPLFSQKTETQKKSSRVIIINSANNIEHKSIHENTDEEKAKTEDDTELKSEKKASAKNAETKEKEITETEKTSSTSESSDSKKTELIILTGNVSVSIKDGKTLDSIFADQIIYNKTRNTMQASSKVKYERKVSGKTTQTFEGESILFDLKKMSGVFLDGVMENKSDKKDASNYLVQSETVGHDESGVTAFKNAKLTTSSSDEPLWSIHASRFWFLPGNEMSFVNGYYSIGIVPIFYLPFFYHPADEMIFHPVFGFKNRQGYFVQTTTYLLGRKKLQKQDSQTTFSDFLVSDTLKEQKRNGLFLQNLNTDAKIQDPSYLKIIADAYSSLGFLIGVDGDFQSAVKYFNALNFNAYFGFSHTLYPAGNKNNFFATYNFGGKSEFNKANFFGKNLPFRYSTDFNATISKSPISLTLNFPFVSDPFFKSDFFDRSEGMNWFKFMLNQEKDEKKKDTSELSSYGWNLEFKANPKTEILAPYLNSFSFSSFMNTKFYSKKNESLTKEDADYAPDRKFYFPQILQPKINLSLSGTIFSTDMLNKKNETQKPLVEVSIEGLENPFLEPDKIETPPAETNTKKKLENQTPDFIENFLPIFKLENQNNDETSKIVSYNLGYDFKFDFLHEGIWDYGRRQGWDGWKEPKDINWNKFKSHYHKTKYTVGLDSSLTLLLNLLKINNKFDFMQNFQKNPYVADEKEKELKELSNFEKNIFEFTNKNSVIISPFYFSEMFKATNFQWLISEILLKNKFTGTYSAPKYEIEKTKWDKNFIKTHDFASTFAITLKNYTQSLKLVSALPPLLGSHSISASFQHPYGAVKADTKIYEKEKADKKWFWDPFNLNASWKLPYEITTSQKFSYNIEDKKSDSFRFDFSWKYFYASFFMQRDFKYKLDKINGWNAVGTEKKFIPKSFEFTFSNTSKPLKFYFWKNRISFFLGLDTSLNMNMQRITESFFKFAPSINFAINDFLTLKIKTFSRNDVIACYFQDFLNLGVTIPGEKNMLKDLLKSFYFWDKDSRKQSGFKLKSVDVSLEHDLKDWKMSFTYSFLPEAKRNETSKRMEYSFIPKFTFLVTWNPINNVRVKTVTENKKFNVERGTIR